MVTNAWSAYQYVKLVRLLPIVILVLLGLISIMVPVPLFAPPAPFPTLLLSSAIAVLLPVRPAPVLPTASPALTPLSL